MHHLMSVEFFWQQNVILILKDKLQHRREQPLPKSMEFHLLKLVPNLILM